MQIKGAPSREKHENKLVFKVNKVFDTVFFDADRTVFDNGVLHSKVAERILKELGKREIPIADFHPQWVHHYFAEQRRFMAEKGFCIDRDNQARSLVLALKDFDINITLEQAHGFWRFMIEEYGLHSKPFPDMLELLAFLAKKKIRLAIVSNGDLELINTRLVNSKIDHYFKFVLAPCKEFPMTKPDIKIFEQALQMIGGSAEKTVFVGDTPEADIKGANVAGMFSVLIDRKNEFEQLEGLLKPDLRISSFLEMKSLFD